MYLIALYTELEIEAKKEQLSSLGLLVQEAPEAVDGLGGALASVVEKGPGRHIGERIPEEGLRNPAEDIPGRTA
jgi:hypothetical protein